MSGRKRTETDGNGQKRTKADGNGLKRTPQFPLVVTLHSDKDTAPLTVKASLVRVKASLIRNAISLISDAGKPYSELTNFKKQEQKGETL